ncbi:MAG TPA: alginate lyase family protein [Candidatus Ventrimonas merdavium]|nr:alginate lyase family protein [Candidatus Ventrimonas merdavium]
MTRQQRQQFAERYGRSRNEQEACAAFVKRWWPEETAHRLRIAEEVTRQEFLFDLPWDMEQTAVPVTFDGEIDWRFRPGDDPEFIYQMNRHRYWVCLGQAYAMTGDERYARAFGSQLVHWVRENPINEETKPTTWRTIEAGLRGESWIKAMGYFVESPSVSDEVFEVFLRSMAEHGAYLAACDVPFSVKSNWGVLENSGLYAIGRMLELMGYEEAASWAELAKQRLTRQIQVQVLDDGVHWEMSAMYHNEVLKCYLEALRQAGLCGDQFPQIVTEKVRAMAMADRIWQKPDGTQPTFGDSDKTDLRDVMTICGAWFGEPVFRSGGYERMDFEGIWDYGTEKAAAYETLEARLPQETFSWQKESGNWYLRSGWDEKADYLHLRCGSLGGGHGHFDKGHLDLMIGGEDLLIDPGRYTYVDGADRRGLKSAASHNGVTVDHREYTRCLDSWGVEGLRPSLPGMCARKGEYTLMECGHLGYQDQGVYIQRRVLAIGTRIYLVMDTCYGEGEHTLTQHFHPAPEVRTQMGADGFTLVGERAQARFFCISQGAEVAQAPAEVSRHYNQKQESCAVTCERTGTGVFGLITVIVCGERDGQVGTAGAEGSARIFADGENEVGGDVCLAACSACRIPVMTAGSKRELGPEEGEGVQVTAFGRTWNVVQVYVEAGADCEYLGAGGSFGLGRVMAAEQGEPDMTVLHW